MQEYRLVEFGDVSLRTVDLSLGLANPGLCAWGANALGENVEAIYLTADMPAATLADADTVVAYSDATEADARGWIADRARRGLTTEGGLDA